MKNRFLTSLIALLLALSLLLTGCEFGTTTPPDDETVEDIPELEAPPIGEDDIPEPSEDPDPADPTNGIYAKLNGNKPYFDAEDITDTCFELYSELDELGRCGVAYACVGIEIMPTEVRDFSLTSISPSGWNYNNKTNNNKYETSVVPGGYIYNRCHLIGYQLTGETTNNKNLITGTKQLNINGMLPFENMVADFIKDTGYHVMYRVTPIYEDYNLLASGVIIEAYSVEDEGDGICFCVYVYNVQPGIEINYFTGENKLEGEVETDEPDETVKSFVINISNGKIHLDSCYTIKQMFEANREDFEGTVTELHEKYPEADYSPCGICKPYN